MKRIVCTMLVGLVGIGLGTTGRADTTYTWNFATSANNGDVPGAGYSHTYLDTSNTYSIPVHGYLTNNAPASSTLGSVWLTGGTSNGTMNNKFTNSLGDPETGLGFTSGIDSQNEIISTSFIQLDSINLKSAHLTNATVTVSSIQQNEGYYLWGSNSAGAPGTLLNTYIDSTGADADTVHQVTIPSFATYRYFSVSASNGNVLLSNGATATHVTATPEPGDLALIFALSVPVGLFARRRRRRA